MQVSQGLVTRWWVEGNIGYGLVTYPFGQGLVKNNKIGQGLVIEGCDQPVTEELPTVLLQCLS